MKKHFHILLIILLAFSCDEELSPPNIEMTVTGRLLNKNTNQGIAGERILLAYKRRSTGTDLYLSLINQDCFTNENGEYNMTFIAHPDSAYAVLPHVFEETYAVSTLHHSFIVDDFSENIHHDFYICPQGVLNLRLINTSGQQRRGYIRADDCDPNAVTGGFLSLSQTTQDSTVQIRVQTPSMVHISIYECMDGFFPCSQDGALIYTDSLYMGAFEEGEMVVEY